MTRDLPSGTVTFLFTDVEGSTQLLHELGAERYAEALAEHRAVIRAACAAHDGVEVDTQGDAFFFAFPTAPGALAAAGEMTEALASGPIRVRIGLHTGTPLLTAEGYVGGDVHRAARIAASGHGGQVLVSSATAALIESSDKVSLGDLGEHRFKDLSAPERVYQLGDSDFPRLKTLYQTNLPVPATPFVGRGEELEQVAGLLSLPDTRLVTLTGPGGTGKTRLVLQAAAQCYELFPDGVFWVPLAPLREGSLLESTVGQALGVTEQPGIPIEEAIVKAFAGRRALLVLDNCEHMVDDVARLVHTLVEGCPRLLIAGSSRERLSLRFERVYAVPPMSISESEMLFVERARAVVPDFERDEHVAVICDGVDGLPLAIELAAARVRSLSTAAIRERLAERLTVLTSQDRQVEERQRTLDATIAWSYELLDREEQRALRAIAVFAGGCTLAGAEAVASTSLALLESLLDKSLIRHRVDEGRRDRYWLLQTIREYALGKLNGAGEAADAQRLHAGYFLHLAEEAEPELRGSESDRWLDCLEVEHPNIRAVMAWARESDEDEIWLRVAGALARFWWIRSYLEEGKEWLQGALARPVPNAPAARARALRGLSYLLWARGEREDIVPVLEEALALYRHVGDATGTSMCLANLGIFWREEGEPGRARPLLEESAAIHRASGDVQGLAHALGQLGVVALEEGDLERARRVGEEGLVLARRAGTDQTVALILEDLAFIALSSGHQEEAQAHLEECLGIARSSDNWSLVGTCLKGAAAVAAVGGDLDRAARILGAAATLDEKTYGVPDPPQNPDDARLLTVVRQHVGDETSRSAWSEGREMSPEEAVEYAIGAIDGA